MSPSRQAHDWSPGGNSQEDETKAKLRKYFSGKLLLVQIVSGIGAFAGRSTAAYLSHDLAVWTIVLASILGSFAGYMGTYAVSYWLTFRGDYRTSGRFMILDIIRLQLVEQLPNVGTVVASGVTQGALISSAGMSPVLAANLTSWFGPHKIINLVAMATSNSLKRAWVDSSWKPLLEARSLVRRVVRLWGH
ncbi:MAG: hypothetical protein V3S51_00690 [Dehalococcoidia bacterium]